MAIEYLIAQYSISISVTVRSRAIIFVSTTPQPKMSQKNSWKNTNNQINNVKKIRKWGLGGEIGRARRIHLDRNSSESRDRSREFLSQNLYKWLESHLMDIKWSINDLIEDLKRTSWRSLLRAFKYSTNDEERCIECSLDTSQFPLQIRKKLDRFISFLSPSQSHR